MTYLELNFWAGLALSIPIGIAINLTTPWLQRQIARRSGRVAERRRKEQLKEQAFAVELRSNPTLYQSFLHLSLVRALTLFAISILAVTIPYPLTDLFQLGTYITGLVPLTPLDIIIHERTLNVVGVVVANVSVVLLLNTGRRARRIAKSMLGEIKLVDPMLFEENSHADVNHKDQTEG
ncbi:hypothetical protein AB0C27_31005 [Nonomuraea sp. NPDC048882]|uniref:hypothetical protein n=1 Tax=Nonomuraea sp. NPDC048882 TaxID=3154347 RepID=UPI0034100A2F